MAEMRESPRNVMALAYVLDILDVASSMELHADRISSLWSMSYHFYIHESDLANLQEHALQASESLQTWSTSPYGRVLKFLSFSTLTAIRRFWNLYADTKLLSPLQSQNSISSRETPSTDCAKTKSTERHIYPWFSSC